MKFQGLNFHLLIATAVLSLMGCASTSSVSTNTEAANSAATDHSLSGTSADSPTQQASSVHSQVTAKKPVESGVLICKASRKRFHYDWSAGALAGGQGLIDQNNIRYVFRSASKPAGARGENLKVGECGWAAEALAEKGAAKNRRQEVVFKSLSDEATQTFYKMKTGKVFQVPVRQTKSGLVVTPGGVRVIR